MTNAQKIADLVRRAVPHVKFGTMCFWGTWFGKAYDNVHFIIGADATESELQLRFSEGESLSVRNPGDYFISEKAFRISDASLVRWHWFYAGRQKTQDNLHFMEFFKAPDGIIYSGDSSRSELLHPSAETPAVEIL